MSASPTLYGDGFNGHMLALNGGYTLQGENQGRPVYKKRNINTRFENKQQKENDETPKSAGWLKTKISGQSSRKKDSAAEKQAEKNTKKESASPSPKQKAGKKSGQSNTNPPGPQPKETPKRASHATQGSAKSKQTDKPKTSQNNKQTPQPTPKQATKETPKKGKKGEEYTTAILRNISNKFCSVDFQSNDARGDFESKFYNKSAQDVLPAFKSHKAFEVSKDKLQVPKEKEFKEREQRDREARKRQKNSMDFGMTKASKFQPVDRVVKADERRNRFNEFPVLAEHAFEAKITFRTKEIEKVTSQKDDWKQKREEDKRRLKEARELKAAQVEERRAAKQVKVEEEERVKREKQGALKAVANEA